MRNIREVMRIADETRVTGYDNDKTERIRNLNRKLCNWFLGIGFSFLPLLALPFSNFLDHQNIGKLFYDLFCDISVIFIGITFTITSLNDFMNENIKNKQDGWIKLSIFMVMLGTVFYSVEIMQNGSSNTIIDSVFKINLGYFLTMFILSLGKYIEKLWEARKCT